MEKVGWKIEAQSECKTILQRALDVISKSLRLDPVGNRSNFKQVSDNFEKINGERNCSEKIL